MIGINPLQIFNESTSISDRPMIKQRYVAKFFSYALGCLCWFILLGILASSCILNVPGYIDGLWVKPVGDGLVENLIGAIAYDVEGYGCEDRLIFVAPYYSSDTDNEPKLESLSSIVDIKTWEKIESDSRSIVYADNFHRYVLLQNSDGINMKIYKK